MALQGDFSLSEITHIYNRQLLDRATEDQVIDKYGQALFIDANKNTNKATATRYTNPAPATTPLLEQDGTQLRPPSIITRTKIEYKVAKFGTHIPYTEELELWDLRDIKKDFLDILGDNAGETFEKVKFNELKGGTNQIFAQGAVDINAVGSGGLEVVAADLKLAVMKLSFQKAKRQKANIFATDKVGTSGIRKAYIGMARYELLESMADSIPKYKRVIDYADGSKAEEHEHGSWGELRFMVADAFDPVVAGGANVYPLFIFGANAYASVSMRKKGSLKTVIKPKGYKDELDEVGSLGWKGHTGAVILNQAHFIELSGTVSLEDAGTKHFYS